MHAQMQHHAASHDDLVSFDISADDARIVGDCVARFASLMRKHAVRVDRLSVSMDLTACHANGCPMDFGRLMAADDFNFVHDVGGITRHLDRSTGRLGSFFRPRFARRTED